jgi:hypothetical protein
MKAGEHGLFVIRLKNKQIVAMTSDLERARRIRTTLYTREKKFSDVMPFRARNQMEREFAKIKERGGLSWD